MVKNILIKSPDEWATTKQACRDESVVYLFLSSTNIYIYIYIYIYITLQEVQASGVIIVYCDSAVSYGPKIIGPHSSGNFND